MKLETCLRVAEHPFELVMYMDRQLVEVPVGALALAAPAESELGIRLKLWWAGRYG